jgi:hypothetical protein
VVLNLDLKKRILHGVKRCPNLSGKSRRIGMEKLTVDRNGKSHHFYSVFACMSEMETVGPEKVLVFGGGGS